ncbi:hypothetical protein [Turicibacter sanguinis]|uniref:hypothetical protein n=1 Tax=Turicibacter sanguinis TaxID=154288 RepID=UPI0006C54A7F|nr:hypothetical protein [Turicibacter sanguinis]CUN11428.1 Uncharacterised protein [Turicibacter sanguinis]
MNKVRKQILSQEEQKLFLVSKATVNYTSTGGAVLETIINCVVFFRYECEAGVLRIYVKGTSTKDKEHLFKELTFISLASGAALHEFAKEWYQEHLEELRLFVKGE